MRLIAFYICFCICSIWGHSQETLDPSLLVLMDFQSKHAHVDSSAVQTTQLDANEIYLVDSLIISIVDYYNVQVTRGSLTLDEKDKLDSLSNLQRDFNLVHKRKAKYKKRKMERFSVDRQSQIMHFANNRDSLYQIMMKYYTKSMRDRRQTVVQFAGLGYNTIEILKYTRQYMPYINTSGERLVYANCLRSSETEVSINQERKAELKQEFMWCGDCYEKHISILINLDKKEVMYLHTN